MLSVVIDNEESTLEFVDFTEHEVILFHFTNTVPIPNTPDTTYNYHGILQVKKDISFVLTLKYLTE
jgi:hypothetical protein